MNGREDIRIAIVIVLAIVVLLLVGSNELAGSSPPLNDPKNRLAGSSPPLNDVGLSGPAKLATAPLEGCLKCHDQIEPMHRYGPTATLDKLDNGKDALGLTCTACHGGNPAAITKDEAHVRPRWPREWMRDGKFHIPERSGPLLEKESLEFVRFLNPGDLRIAAKTCGTSECHSTQTNAVGKSMMTHGAMLWGAAVYNNGGFPIKAPNYGVSYSSSGALQSLVQTPPQTAQKR